MADQSDVEKALVTVIGASLFPTISYQPGDYQTSTAGLLTRLYRGWPEQTSLLNDLAAGKAHVSVYPESGMLRTTSRWFPDWQTVSTPSPTIRLSGSGTSVTVGGTVTPGNVVGVAFGPSTLLAAYAYICLSGDTLATVAAALAALIPRASSSGPVITLPSSLNVAMSTAAPATGLLILRQQEQVFRVSCWAPTPTTRDALASTVDLAIASILGATGLPNPFIQLTATDTGRIKQSRTYSSDLPARVNVWRRDLCYSVDYPTTLIQSQPIMLFGAVTISAGNALGASLNVAGQIQPSTTYFSDGLGNVYVDAAGNLIGAPA